jgi:predicted KAP-like P-loop ATPase
MGGTEIMQIAQHVQVEKALNRLRAMGLKVELLADGENKAYIFITLDSVIKLIERQIKYPNKKLYYESPFIVIEVWRGE